MAKELSKDVHKKMVADPIKTLETDLIDNPISSTAYKYQIRRITDDARLKSDNVDAEKELDFLNKEIDNYFSQTDFLNGSINLPEKTNFDFIVELLDLKIGMKTCIIDYQNIEEMARDRGRKEAKFHKPFIQGYDRSEIAQSISKIKFRIPIVLIIKWAMANNMKNIIIISKRNKYLNNDINKIIRGESFNQDLASTWEIKTPKYIYNVTDMQEAVKQLNIIHINTTGIIGTIQEAKTSILHDMRGFDDATVLLIIQKINKNIIGTPLEKKERVVVLSNDRKMLEENYSYVPPFSVEYVAYVKGVLYKNRFVFNTNLSPFFSQLNYLEYLAPFVDYYTREDLTNETFLNYYFQPQKYNGSVKNWWTQPMPRTDPDVDESHTLAVLNSTHEEAVRLLRDSSISKPKDIIVSPYYGKYLKYRDVNSDIYKSKYLKYRDVNSDIYKSKYLKYRDVNSDIYKSKYLKYKNKYLALKYKL